MGRRVLERRGASDDTDAVWARAAARRTFVVIGKVCGDEAKDHGRVSKDCCEHTPLCEVSDLAGSRERVVRVCKRISLAIAC